MRTYGELSIKRKLQVIITVTAGAALVMASAALLTYDRASARSEMVKDLTILAEIIGENNTASLSFNDPKTADEILQGLRAQPHMVSARIYDSSGRPFASFQRADRKGRQRRLGPKGSRSARIV